MNVGNEAADAGGDDVSGAADALMKRLESGSDAGGDAEQEEQDESAEAESETVEDSDEEHTDDNPKEEEEEEDTEGQDEEPKAKADDDSMKVKLRVGDEDREMTLAELKRGYMATSTFTKKTQELAEARKSFISTADQYQQQVKVQLDEVGFLANTFMQQIVDVEKTTDWNALRQQNPAEYAARQHDLNERRALLNRAMATYKAHAQAQEAIDSSKLEQHLSDEAELLTTLVPEWLDPRVASSEKKALATYLVDQGVAVEDIEALSDAHTVAIARKAMLFDRMTAARKQAEQKAAKPVQKFSKPGTPRNPASNKPLHQKLETRARKSGRVEDFGASLASKYGAL